MPSFPNSVLQSETPQSRHCRDIFHKVTEFIAAKHKATKPLPYIIWELFFLSISAPIYKPFTAHRGNSLRAFLNHKIFKSQPTGKQNVAEEMLSEREAQRTQPHKGKCTPYTWVNKAQVSNRENLWCRLGQNDRHQVDLLGVTSHTQPCTRAQLREPALLTHWKSWHKVMPHGMEDLPLNQRKLSWTLIKLGNTPLAQFLQVSLQDHSLHTQYPLTVAYQSNGSRHTQALTHQYHVHEVNKTEVSMNPKYCTYLKTSNLLLMLSLNSIPQRRTKHF